MKIRESVGLVALWYGSAVWITLCLPYGCITIGTIGEYVMTAGNWLDDPDPRYARKWTKSEAQQGYRRSADGDSIRHFGSSTEFVGPPSFGYKLGRRWSAMTDFFFRNTWPELWGEDISLGEWDWSYWFWGAVLVIATVAGAVKIHPCRYCKTLTFDRCEKCKRAVCTQCSRWVGRASPILVCAIH